MKTAPFNLEMALAGAPVVTRNGQEVAEIELSGHDYPVLYRLASGSTLTVTSDGRFFMGGGESFRDILMRLPDDPDPVTDDWRFNHFEP
jgi:hypothetical protein